MTKTILHIDDDLDNMRPIRQAMESDGYRFLWCGNGMRGIELATHSCPDVILLDIRLPDITGFEVAQRLRSSGIASLLYVPIIAISGCDFDGIAYEALTAGCDAYMAKPIDLRKLHLLVEACIAPGDLDLPFESSGNGIISQFSQG